MKRQTTKEIIAESFLELAGKKRIDKITIAEITGNCQMTPPTFYNHFKDKYDLIVWIYVNDAGKILGKIGRDGYEWRDTLRDAAAYYAENRDFAINALTHTSGRDSFLLQVEKTNIDLLVDIVKMGTPDGRIPDDIYGMIKVYCYGTVQFMFEWLVEGMKISPDKIAEIWEESLPEPLKKYLYRRDDL